MFKKLKEKITEEVKISPQRFQQLSQSVTDRLQNSSTTDDNFFSIAEDDANMSNTSLEPGFSNVSLTSPQEPRVRRSSNSSLASDVSFLPRYESLHNMYHLQSDLDASASEMEDNASTSSQLGHLSKEQIYSAFQKAQIRYHKYRGRYTDLAKHYKDLERENTKMKSVLVDTQDKAIRRVTELREQCALEQKAKAHLEAALRDEIDEGQLKIESLQTKVGLLQNGHNNANHDAETLDTLNKYLTDARSEIESLNSRIQELKANAIIFQTKEQEYKLKISGLDKEISLFSEREKENNLTLAQNKMELHNELLSKDAEISKLKQDNETLRQNLDTLNNGNLKMENLQIQNKKLIDKLESLTQKCNNYENEQLRMEQYKVELQTSNHTNTELKNSLKEAEKRLDEVREDAKNSLLNLEAKVRENIQQEFQGKEAQIRQEFQSKFEEVSANADNLQTIQLDLIEKDDEIKRLREENDRCLEELSAKAVKYGDLESTHLELIEECSNLRNTLNKIKKDFNTAQQRVEEKNLQIEKLEKEYQLLLDGKNISSQEDITKNNEIERLKSVILGMETQLKLTNESLEERILIKENELQQKIQAEENYQQNLEESFKILNLKNKEILDMRDQLESFEKQSKFLEQKYEESSKETNELNAARLVLIEEIKNLKGESEKYQTILEERQKEIVILTADIQKSQSIELNSQSLIEKCQKLEESLKHAQQKLETEETNKEELKIVNSQLREKIKTISEQKKLIESSNQEEIDKNKEVLEDLKKNNSRLKEEIENTIKERNSIELSNGEKRIELEEKIDSLSSELTQLRKLTEENDKEKSVFLVEINSLEKLLEEANNNCAIKEHDLAKISENYLLSKQKIIELTQNIYEQSNKIADFESEIELKNQQIKSLSTKIEDCSQLNQDKNHKLFEILNEVVNGSINSSNNDNKKLLNIEEKLQHFETSFSTEKENLAKHLVHLRQFQDRYNALLSDNEGLVTQVKELQGQVYELNALKQIEGELLRLKEENRSLSEENHKTKQDLLELQSQNTKVTTDSNYLSDENHLLMTELEDIKLKNEDLKMQLNNTKLEVNAQKSEISTLSNQLDELSNHEYQLKELEKHIEELQHEKQLFQDEIQELKIDPVNVQNLKLDQTNENYVKEIENLRLKVTQYKSLDLTNKSSIEFYENELQKLKNQNEKLNRKLDETLVTLNHCAELSNSTEIEYLKNVLYNYMLGKESLVLARVIAAVCKFDPNQTETILAKEQQKQTLLGQLGIL